MQDRLDEAVKAKSVTNVSYQGACKSESPASASKSVYWPRILMIEEVSVHSIFSLKLGMFVLVMRKLLWSIDDTIKWHLLHELESCRMDRRGVQKFTCEGRVEYCTRIVQPS